MSSHINSDNYEKTKELLSKFKIEYKETQPDPGVIYACDLGLDVTVSIVACGGIPFAKAMIDLFSQGKLKVNFTTRSHKVKSITKDSTTESILETTEESRSILFIWEK